VVPRILNLITRVLVLTNIIYHLPPLIRSKCGLSAVR